MERLRKLPLLIAAICILFALCLEIGSAGCSGDLDNARSAIQKLQAKEGLEVDRAPKASPGWGLPYVAFLDGLLLINTVFMFAALILPARKLGLVQGVAWLIISILGLIGCVIAVIVAVIALITMISLLLAFPFGTIAYMALYASFDKSGAAAVLGVALLFKIGFGISLVVAHQRFLQNKGLVLLFFTSLLASFLLGLLHGFPPFFLVSITDVVGAIIAAILCCIWLIAYLVGGVTALVKEAT